MSSFRVAYIPRPNTTQEAELSALASVYTFILQKHQERQRATRPGGPDDAKKGSSRHEVRARNIIPKRP